jgi:hypothetical protein
LRFETGAFVFSEGKVIRIPIAGSDDDHKPGVTEFTGCRRLDPRGHARSLTRSRFSGGSKATITRRLPQIGHFIRVSSRAIGKFRPRVQIRVARSIST